MRREKIKAHRRCCETVEAKDRVVQLQDETGRLLESAEAQKDPYPVLTPSFILFVSRMVRR